MYESKTKETEHSVEEFLNQVTDEQKRADSFFLMELMQKNTGKPPKMWGSSIVGFGFLHYKYASGHEGDTCWVGFSPRKRNLTLYFTPGLYDFGEFLTRLGKHKTGVGCVYINKLSDVNISVLEEMIQYASSKLDH